MLGEHKDNGLMKDLEFKKDEDMSVHTWKSILKQDPLRGNFDPATDFKGEVFVDIEWYNSDGQKTDKVAKAIRITVCPYDNPRQCPWRWGPTIIGDILCQAVKQTAYISDREVIEKHTSRCKADVAHKDRNYDN